MVARFITRRHIRIKVVQTIYAYKFSPLNEVEDLIRFFKFSANNAVELFFYEVSLLNAIFTLAKHRLQKSQSAVSNPKSTAQKYLKITNNPFLQAIALNQTIQKNIASRFINFWKHDDIIVDKILEEIKQHQDFAEYFCSENNTASDHKKFLIDVFRSIIVESTAVQLIQEDQFLTHSDDFPFVNTYILRELKRLNLKDIKQIRVPDPDQLNQEITFGVSLIELCCFNQKKLVEEYKPLLENWSIDRLAVLDAVILKIAIAEMLYKKCVPPKVTINEYVEIAKEYSTHNSGIFINGILDRLLKIFQSEKRLQNDHSNLKN